jgi:hypothetical protein
MSCRVSLACKSPPSDGCPHTSKGKPVRSMPHRPLSTALAPGGLDKACASAKRLIGLNHTMPPLRPGRKHSWVAHTLLWDAATNHSHATRPILPGQVPGSRPASPDCRNSYEAPPMAINMAYIIGARAAPLTATLMMIHRQDTQFPHDPINTALLASPWPCNRIDMRLAAAGPSKPYTCCLQVPRAEAKLTHQR